MVPALDGVVAKLTGWPTPTPRCLMMSRTHGQPATPSTMGKEMANVAYRLQRARARIAAVGAARQDQRCGRQLQRPPSPPTRTTTGNPSPGVSSNPWAGLQPYTIQIEPHDALAELFDAFARANSILIDLDRDIWGYISLGFFKQKVKAGEIGSSTMPTRSTHRFRKFRRQPRPANAVLKHLAEKPPSRAGSATSPTRRCCATWGRPGLHPARLRFAAKGLNKLEINADLMKADLDANWELLAEPIQTVMRRYGIAKPTKTQGTDPGHPRLPRGHAGLRRGAGNSRGGQGRTPSN